MISSIRDIEAALPTFEAVESAKEWVNSAYAIDQDEKAWTWLRGVGLGGFEVIGALVAIAVYKEGIQFYTGITHIALSILNLFAGEYALAAKELVPGLLGSCGITLVADLFIGLGSIFPEALCILIPSVGSYIRSARYYVLDWSARQVSLLEGHPEEAYKAGSAVKRWTIQTTADQVIEGVVSWAILSLQSFAQKPSEELAS